MYLSSSMLSINKFTDKKLVRIREYDLNGKNNTVYYHFNFAKLPNRVRWIFSDEQLKIQG
jgi:hypothetical protein